jgi:hypothetical protein
MTTTMGINRSRWLADILRVQPELQQDPGFVGWEGLDPNG